MTFETIHARQYGSAPLRIAVVHGGPGAAGPMAPVAERLAARGFGVLEPLQSAAIVSGQIAELRTTIASRASPPVTLVGHSWGAWLSCLVAAECPHLVRDLILVGTPPFEERYVAQLRANRAQRADDFAPLEAAPQAPVAGIAERAAEIFAGVWPEAARLRRTGELLLLIERIRCPVLAIHGDLDPHPVEGALEPLRTRLADFDAVVLQRCGHDPWRERYASEAFHALLEQRLSEN